jgi:phosphoribosylamine--glycine ligase
MKILLVGSGGREHAMSRALKTSPEVELLIAPGNPGTAPLGANRPVDAEDILRLVALARAESVDLVVPGPEGPLVAGLADALEAVGIPCAGPGRAAARLEGSKAFTRALAEAAGVPSPAHRTISSVGEIDAALARFEVPPVVKADGLAAGKGVFLPDTIEECRATAEELLGGRLGAAGSTVVLEERLVGVEVSAFHACRGTEAIALPHAMDHKRLLDGDRGPNTGGMGAVSPNPYAAGLDAAVLSGFVVPSLRRLADDGSPFNGFLFSGLIVTDGSPRLLEFNVRLGDPEAQAILPRLPDGVFSEICAWVAGLRDRPPHFEPDRRATCAVVLAAAGYPDAPRRGDPITIAPGMETADRWLIHAATRMDAGTLVTDGGRVGAVVGRGDTAATARAVAYEGVTRVQWEGMVHRRDIGAAVDG